MPRAKCPVCRKGTMHALPKEHTPKDHEGKPLTGKQCAKCGAFVPTPTPEEANRVRTS